MLDKLTEEVTNTNNYLTLLNLEISDIFIPSNKSCRRHDTACDDQAASDAPVANLTNFKSCSSVISSHKLIAGRVDTTSLATT